MCRPIEALSPQPTSLRGAELDKRVEEENGRVESAEEKEVDMERVEVDMEGVEVEEQKEGEEPSKMVRWGSSPDSTHLEHC